MSGGVWKRYCVRLPPFVLCCFVVRAGELRVPTMSTCRESAMESSALERVAARGVIEEPPCQTSQLEVPLSSVRERGRASARVRRTLTPRSALRRGVHADASSAAGAGLAGVEKPGGDVAASAVAAAAGWALAASVTSASS